MDLMIHRNKASALETKHLLMVGAFFLLSLPVAALAAGGAQPQNQLGLNLKYGFDGTAGSGIAPVTTEAGLTPELVYQFSSGANSIHVGYGVKAGYETIAWGETATSAAGEVTVLTPSLRLTLLDPKPSGGGFQLAIPMDIGYLVQLDGNSDIGGLHTSLALEGRIWLGDRFFFALNGGYEGFVVTRFFAGGHLSAAF